MVRLMIGDAIAPIMTSLDIYKYHIVCTFYIDGLIKKGVAPVRQ